MHDPSRDAGLIQVLAERLASQRLPRILDIKANVDRGEVLKDMDLAFLEEVLADAGKIAPLVGAHPEWQDLVGRVMQLYKQVTTKALENQEREAGSNGRF
ncbi:MAG: hypothetical protein FD187_2209 [bacterium]|nr:MAG: hypothetical protein FD142_2584 [bacterium]KAF0148098.1 MAG: hypothetical protein FD187_2209 [bacterium]KAF0167636.1 MAG: hypothetical protein FD158_2112 [bacterium]TXT19454.1 MAG: hypothetical protein FD132_1723 [bacterium]